MEFLGKQEESIEKIWKCINIKFVLIFKYEFYIVYLHAKKLKDMKKHLLKSSLFSPAAFHPTNLSRAPSCTPGNGWYCQFFHMLQKESAPI